jgi:hypothetical protein
MQSIAKGDVSAGRQGRSLLLAAVFAAGCSGAAGEMDDSPSIEADGVEERLTTTPEDGLVDAFDTFANAFGAVDLDGQFQIGYGFHPGLIREKVVGADGALAAGQARLNMYNGNISATLNNVPTKGNFDLWFVKNVAGGTVAPESTDQMLKVGSFTKSGANRTLSVAFGTKIFFDLDLIVVTRGGKKPFEAPVAIGERTLFEKRLFRFRQSQSLDPVTGPLANNIETTDPLVARGAQLFFNETFGGNGRTCGTCHRAEHSLTISPAFIATLPQSDPLFVAENNPALAQLENSELLRSRALIVENLDGFDDPTNKFVMRSVQHTLSLGLTNGLQSGSFSGQAPDHRLGWSGDGGPGRSTLHDFTFGAIMQHFTKTLARRPGVDFRVPTEEELDALEAFQLFTGRQKVSDFGQRAPTDARAQSGQNLLFVTGCTICHGDLDAFADPNLNFDTGVANLTPDLPFDDGFSSPGSGTFNVPPLAEAADTAPLFHNNAVDSIEDAVAFYFSPTFQASPSSFFIFNQLSTEEQGDVAAFLRVVNSAANIDEVRRRVQYIRNVRSAGNTDLLNIAIADTRDAHTVLSEKQLSADVQEQLLAAETQLEAALKAKDKDRPSMMKKALRLLDEARAELFTDTPPDPGSGGSANGGSGPIMAGAPSAGTFSSGGSGTAGTAPLPPDDAGL